MKVLDPCGQLFQRERRRFLAIYGEVRIFRDDEGVAACVERA